MTRKGPLNLKKLIYEQDDSVLEDGCVCFACKNHTKAYIHRLIRNKETVGCHLLSIHNIAYQMRLMSDIRDSIEKDQFPSFVQQFMFRYYKERNGEIEPTMNDPGRVVGENGYPVWITNSMTHVGIKLL